MDNIERIAIYKGVKYFRLDDATAAIGLMGRTYNFNMAIEQVGAKIVKIPGFGNSYFLSETDLLNVEQHIKNNVNGLGGERVDAGTGQVVTKVQPYNNDSNNQSTQNTQASAVNSQQMGAMVAANNINPNSSNGTANQKLNPNQTDTLPEQQGNDTSQNVANEAVQNSNPKGASGNGLASNNQNSSSNS